MPAPSRLTVAALLLSAITWITVAAPTATAAPKLLSARTAIKKERALMQGIKKQTTKVGRYVGPQIEPFLGTGLLMGDLADVLSDVDEETGEEVLLDTSGGMYFDSELVGVYQGTLLANSTGIVDEGGSVNVDINFELDWEFDTAASIDLRFDFQGVTYADVPFVVTVFEPEPAGNPGAFFQQFPVFPADGSLATSVVLPAPGYYRLQVDWQLTEFALPLGDTSFGIESYAIHWAVPEPSSLVTGLSGAGTFLAFALHRRARQKRRATATHARRQLTPSG